MLRISQAVTVEIGVIDLEGTALVDLAVAVVVLAVAGFGVAGEIVGVGVVAVRNDADAVAVVVRGQGGLQNVTAELVIAVAIDQQEIGGACIQGDLEDFAGINPVVTRGAGPRILAVVQQRENAVEVGLEGKLIIRRLFRGEGKDMVRGRGSTVSARPERPADVIVI